MKTLRFPDGFEVSYELSRKPVKNINLRVREDGTLGVSANSRVSVKTVEDFILSQRDFIARALGRIQKRRELSEITSEKISWLGREYPVRIISSARECAVCEQNELRVFTRHPEGGHAERLISGWLAGSFAALCGELDAEVRSALTGSGITPPPVKITIKDMRSRWGSCTWAKGHISLNIRLAAYPRETVLSVLWHEYSHLWHHDHSEKFYAFLEEHFPEYKRWNGLLKGDSL